MGILVNMEILGEHVPGDSIRDLFGMVKFRDPFKGLESWPPTIRGWSLVTNWITWNLSFPKIMGPISLTITKPPFGGPKLGVDSPIPGVVFFNPSIPVW